MECVADSREVHGEVLGLVVEVAAQAVAVGLKQAHEGVLPLHSRT